MSNTQDELLAAVRWALGQAVRQWAMYANDKRYEPTGDNSADLGMADTLEDETYNRVLEVAERLGAAAGDMQTKNDTSKPEDSPKQEASEGCSGATCSACRADAENWGNALHEAAWEYIAAYQEITGEKMTGHHWNNAKTILRRAMLKYFDLPKDSEPNVCMSHDDEQPASGPEPKSEPQVRQRRLAMPLVGAEYTRGERTAECEARCGEWLWLIPEELSRLKRPNAKLCEEGGK